MGGWESAASSPSTMNMQSFFNSPGQMNGSVFAFSGGPGPQQQASVQQQPDINIQTPQPNVTVQQPDINFPKSPVSLGQEGSISFQEFQPAKWE